MLTHRTSLRHPSPRTPSRSRRGIAIVELAVCLPVIVTVVFGAIETANVIFLKQALSVAAYEAAQRATASGGTETRAQVAADAVLAAHGVEDGSVSISPEVTAETPAGTEVVVTTTAPLPGNTYLFQFFQSDSTISSTMTMMRL